MKIAVLNGSPKGELSVTVQYVKYIQKKFPKHSMTFYNISQNIKKIERDRSAFDTIIKGVEKADLVIWSVPLYVCLVPSQYKRFIEMIGELKADHAFRGKYAAVITTSIHFYDHTAHNYMRAVTEDLGMKFAGAFSPDMFDLMKDDEREKLLTFAESVYTIVTNKSAVTRSFQPLQGVKLKYSCTPGTKKIDQGDKKILVVTDAGNNQKNLLGMIEKFRDSFVREVGLVNLNDIDIKGGCLGCCQCGFDYRCVYTGADGYIDFYNTEMKTADILIFAGSIRDRYLSSKWKQVFDRAFFNTHTPTLLGKQIGYLISGPLGQIPNLREILTAYTEWQKANIVDFITDEYASSEELDAIIEGFAEKMLMFADKGFISPESFLGVGGMKVFRDDIWGRLRFVFQADHRFYEKHGYYDFPQKDKKAKDMNKSMIAATKNPAAREQIRKMIKTEMVKGHQHIVATK